MIAHLVRPVVTVLLIATVLVPSSTQAEGARTATFHREGVESTFEFVAGCLATTVRIRGLSYLQQTDPGAPRKETFAEVGVYERDTCAEPGQVARGPLEAEGTIRQEDFQLVGHLGRATLNTTLEGIDWSTGESVAFTINASFEGVGKIASEKLNEQTDDDGCRRFVRGTVAFRDATASGTLAYGDTTLSLTNPSEAQLQSQKSGRTEVGCPPSDG